MQLHGGGHSIRSFIHIQDVAEATLKVALHGEPGGSYHISTRSTISIRELVEQICQLGNVPFESLVEVTGDRLGKDQAYLLDSSAIREKLSWEDGISLEKGLTETLAWMDGNLDVLTAQNPDYVHKP